MIKTYVVLRGYYHQGYASPVCVIMASSGEEAQEILNASATEEMKEEMKRADYVDTIEVIVFKKTPE
jgi:hypothetical protein